MLNNIKRLEKYYEVETPKRIKVDPSSYSKEFYEPKNVKIITVKVDEYKPKNVKKPFTFNEILYIPRSKSIDDVKIPFTLKVPKQEFINKEAYQFNLGKTPEMQIINSNLSAENGIADDFNRRVRNFGVEGEIPLDEFKRLDIAFVRGS